MAVALGMRAVRAVAVAPHTGSRLDVEEPLHQAGRSLGMLRGVGQAPGVVADDPDDVLLVLEGELFLDRLAVAGREREVVHPQRVTDAPVREERDGLPGPGTIDPADAVVV